MTEILYTLAMVLMLPLALALAGAFGCAIAVGIVGIALRLPPIAWRILTAFALAGLAIGVIAFVHAVWGLPFVILIF